MESPLRLDLVSQTNHKIQTQRVYEGQNANRDRGKTWRGDLEKGAENLKVAMARKNVVFKDGLYYWKQGLVEKIQEKSSGRFFCRWLQI